MTLNDLEHPVCSLQEEPDSPHCYSVRLYLLASVALGMTNPFPLIDWS